MNFSIFGNPIEHSLSPKLHYFFAKQFHLEIDYQKCLVPLNQFKKTVDAFRKNGGRGANITLPFKKEAFHYTDQHTLAAKETHTVNTFIFKNDLCIGDNTDGIGFIRHLKRLNFNIKDQKILIIGAGGAVQGILGEIIREKPKKIVLLNRTVQKAKDLIDFFCPKFPIEIFSKEEEFDLIINATTMNFDEFTLKFNLSNTLCYDLNYGNRHFTFFQWARLHKAKQISDGLGMLIEQGAESFYQWFGKRPNHAIPNWSV